MTESTFWKLRQFWNESFFIPMPKFTAEDIPDLSGKVMIVTGGNTGIGKETVKALLRKNAKVYMASRSRAKAEAAIDDLERETGKKAIFLELDLADLATVKRAAEAFQSHEKELHVLFNNGGVMRPDVKVLTKQGYDMQFGTNVLGHHYFTTLLLPTLLATAKHAPPGTVRVITTSSSGSYLFPEHDINYETLTPGVARDKIALQDMYVQSKFGNTLDARELSRRYASEGITSIAVNPVDLLLPVQGNIDSDLGRTMSKFTVFLLRTILLHPTPYGAITQLYAGTAPEAADHNGKFLMPWGRVGQHTKASNDPDNALRLWNWLDAQVKAWEEGRSANE